MRNDLSGKEGKSCRGIGDFAAGPGPRTLSIAGLPPFAPLICYEAIFPGEVVGDERPEWLVNVTNDAWFGNSTGPRQHLAAARLRSVEEGLPLARAAALLMAMFVPLSVVWESGSVLTTRIR